MTDKKILVLDIDGTLVNSEKKITPETLKYLKMIQEQGHIVALTISGVEAVFGCFGACGIWRLCVEL